MSEKKSMLENFRANVLIFGYYFAIFEIRVLHTQIFDEAGLERVIIIYIVFILVIKLASVWVHVDKREYKCLRV